MYQEPSSPLENQLAYQVEELLATPAAMTNHCLCRVVDFCFVLINFINIVALAYIDCIAGDLYEGTTHSVIFNIQALHEWS
jgi:hypothetical protein